jgi:thiol-disulfide isomerase/thioredoxin
MSLFRPHSALILPIVILLGCSSAAPFKMFGRADSESADSLGNDVPPADDFATASPTNSNSPADQANSNDPASGALAQNAQAPASEPPPTFENKPENPVQLASSSLNPFEALKFAMPGTAKARETALSREIAKFEPFPFEFQLPTVAGESVSSKQFGGQLMVVDIWATWCAPCKKAIPDFIAVQEEFQAQGVQVIGITCDSAEPSEASETARKAFAIGQQMGVNYPLLVDDGTTTKQVPGFRGYPTTLFVTPDGIVRYKVTGAQSKEKLAAMINAILQY